MPNIVFHRGNWAGLLPGSWGGERSFVALGVLTLAGAPGEGLRPAFISGGLPSWVGCGIGSGGPGTQVGFGIGPGNQQLRWVSLSQSYRASEVKRSLPSLHFLLLTLAMALGV